MKSNQKYTARDYEFMQSLSEAVLSQTPKKWRLVLYVWLFTFSAFIIWAYFSEVDEIIRSQGEIIASGDNQVIQNLEGGVVEEILVKVGESVEKNQVLLKISNEKFQANFETNQIKKVILEAKVARLKAESEQSDFEPSAYLVNGYPLLVKREREIFVNNRIRHESELNALEKQLIQRQSEFSESKDRARDLKKSLTFINEEISISRPMAEKGVYSRIDFLKLQREQNALKERMNSVQNSLKGLKAAVSEAEVRIKTLGYELKTESLEKLNEVMSELAGHNANSEAVIDQVQRTVVRSPIKGVVQNIYVNTIGGVIRPAENLVEIVPSDAPLEVSVRIQPSDIAFVYPGQEAIVKVSAYDFSLYGGLDGVVSQISADTITDDQQDTFYLVNIITNKNYFGLEAKSMYITPGMTVDVDILTGKKSVLDYILKPIIKSKHYTFSER